MPIQLIGILGGVASGKSAVADRLGQLGAVVLDADDVAHEVLRDEDIKRRIAARFGADVLDEAGEVRRGALAKSVFADSDAGRQALADLETLMHPAIGQRIQQKIDAIAHDDPQQVIVLDAAVMMKAGWHKLCDRLIFVEVSPDVRVQRSRSRGWSDDEVASREARQTPLAEKRAAADVIIDNSGDLAQTYAQVDRFWAKVRD